MTTKEALIKVKARLAAGWTQGSAAKDKFGYSCAPGADSATSWCLIGALMAENAPGAAYGALYKVLPPGETDLSLWNDRKARTKDEVLNLVEEAISVA